jgi:acetyl esterase
MAADLSGMHADYQKIKAFNFAFNPFVAGLANSVFRLERWRYCRSPNPEVSVERFTITSADGHAVPVIELKAKDALPGRPVILYYHGGAFAFTWASLHYKSCEQYALATGASVLLVDYRLGPRHVFPVPFEDSYAALTWVRSHAAERGYDPTRVATMGDSAGGYFAAAVAQKAVDDGNPITAAVLIYPVLDSNCDSTSATEFTNTPVWTAVSNRRMWDMFLKQVPEGTDPDYASPGHRKNLSDQPPAYIETAEFDPLRDEGQAYATALEKAGVEVERNETRGTVHGYELAADNPVVKDSMERRCRYLQRVLATG